MLKITDISSKLHVTPKQAKIIGIAALVTIVLAAAIFILIKIRKKIQLQNSMATPLKYIDTYKGADYDTFKQAVYTTANNLGVQPNWLMGVMYFESRLNPQAQNPTTKATGLIQFMPSTASDLGTSTDELMNMTGTEQMDYVYQYLNKYSYSQPIDLYLAVFYPAAIGQSNDYVIGGDSANAIAKENPIFNPTGKSYITVGDVASVITPYLT